ncbi:MAG: glycosyltransferase [Deltaproteobacteria bacterium]|nr:glycosyltransferase [Deltaproteobacteria bacterium]
MPSLATLFCSPDRLELPELLTHAPEYHGATRTLKQDRGTTVTLVSLPTGAIVIKHHRLSTWRQWGDSLLHGSPARRAWHGAQLLQAAGITVPRPLAVVERRTAGFVRESFYVSEALLSHIPLNVYWKTHQHPRPRQQRRTFLRALADFVRSLHAAGLSIGDLKDENVLVQEQEAHQWRFVLVDLDRVTHKDSLSQSRRLKNLVQLERTLGRNASINDRLFFLHQYLGMPLPPRAQRHDLLRRVLALRDQKNREYARRRARHNQQQHPTTPPLPDLVRAEHRPLITCCIICFNEETNLRRCLESVKWCDEIVIVDSFSTDQTVSICQEYTRRIIQRPWPGYVEQKRFALSQATHEWVLNVDADEEVSPELRHEMLAVLHRNHPDVDGYYMPRLVYYLGRWWWRGWYPGLRLRLFRKAKVRWGGVDPHEKVILQGQADRLRGDLYHYTYDDIHDHLRALNGLTEVASRELALRRKRAHLADLLLRPFWRFFRFYVVNGGFREGVPGFFVAVTSAFYVFLKYAKLRERTTQPLHAEHTQHPSSRSGKELGWRGSPGVGTHHVSQPRRPPVGRRE